MLGKRGRYPEFSVETPSHLLVTSGERCWSAVIQPPLPKDWEWGEAVTLSPEEIRLFAAVTLCEPNPWENGLLYFTHWNLGGVDPAAVSEDLTSATAREILEEEVFGLLAQGEDNREWLAAKSGSYNLGGTTGSRDEAYHLLQVIDVQDQLLLAGLGRLLQAGRLSVGFEGPEDMTLPLFVSMGAAFEFLRGYLSAERGADQPMQEVFNYLRSTFPHGDEVVEYFEMMYDYRVLSVHPASRLGEFWASPLMVGQVYELRKSVIGLYRHILTGDVGPK